MNRSFATRFPHQPHASYLHRPHASMHCISLANLGSKLPSVSKHLHLPCSCCHPLLLASNLLHNTLLSVGTLWFVIDLGDLVWCSTVDEVDVATRRRMWRRCIEALVALLALCAAVEADEVHANAKELHAHAKKAADGVAHLEKDGFFRLLATKEKRPYHVFVYLTADAHTSSQIKEYRDNFGHVARSYMQEYKGTDRKYDVFFVDLEHQESPEIFHMLQVKQIPFAFHIRPDFKLKSYTDVSLDQEDMIPKHVIGGGVEALAEYVRLKTGLGVSKIIIPKFYEKPLFFPVLGVAVLTIMMMVYQLFQTGILFQKYLYLIGALVVYWLSVSGIMFDIIRGVPFNGFNPQKKTIQWFTKQNSYQFVAEGLIMGASYTISGLSLCLITIVAPKFKDPAVRRIFTYTGLLGFYWAFKYTSAVYTWKTGFSARSFNPSWFWALNLF